MEIICYICGTIVVPQYSYAMTTATITCHDVYNYGASLQAYALQQVLGLCGIDNVIIDYKPPYLSTHFSFKQISSKYNKPGVRLLYYLYKFPGRVRALKRKRAFDAFTAERLKLTPTRYHNINELRQSPPIADCYIAGSDQIWNTLFPNGLDPAFYLDFCPEGSRKIAYAASFATQKLHCDEQHTAQIARWIHAFDAISIREASGLEILKGLNRKDGRTILDPVFLLYKSAWDKIARKPKGFSEKQPYVLVYDCEIGDNLKDVAIETAKAYDAKICSINFKKSYASINLPYIGPDNFLWLIANAECIVTNSFHATAFSVIFQRPFWVVPRSEAINSRIVDLLNSFSLSGRYRAIGKYHLPIDSPIFFDKALQMMDIRRDLALEFLTSAIYGK